ncbi:DNA polymerase IV [Rubripirellula tenax]|uniref:DNA polymerase IV n=2 Tax=Rubripirellula tenax TaxID=2528015 RepID=A0A5C6FGS5_9BACT|nr:DNA polymerase IV [Rubripirellula tenax]
MSIAQAHQMCLAAELDDVVVQRHDEHLDRQQLDQVAWWMQQTISPMVAIESLDTHPWAGHLRHQCESLICDIAGIAHLFGGEAGTLDAVTTLLTSMGLAGRLAIADSVGAAWAVAHTRIAKSHAAEDRCFIVPPGDDRAAIEDLPVTGLRIAPETAETLGRLGVETIGHLLRLPRSGIAPRLGIGLVRRIEQALGEVDEPVGVYHAEAEHSETLSMEYPTTDSRILADRIERLTDQVRAGLATRQRGALRLTCRLDLSIHPPLTLDIGLFAPSADAKHLSGLLVHRLEQIRLRSAVERLTVSVTLTGPLRTVQTPLFESASPTRSTSSTHSLSGSSISRLIDSLSGRLGRNAVVELKLTGDPLPENAYQTFPMAGNLIGDSNRSGRHRRSHATHRRYSSFHPSPTDAMRRPVALLKNPLPLSIAWADSSFACDTCLPTLPERLRIHGVTHRIVRHWGPERIETGWWKGPSINRDYYRIETDRNQWWWIFRQTISKVAGQPSDATYRWMLHGHFS